MPTLTKLETSILVGAAHDLLTLRNSQMPGGYGHAELKTSIRGAIDGRVRCNAYGWTRGPTEQTAFRMAISRAYKRLEDRGLVRRVAMGSRCTHLVITTEGIKLAQNLTTTPTDGPIIERT